MLETSLFVAGIAALGMLSPAVFHGDQNAARYPRLAAMMTAFGVICGVATHMSYCVAGLAVVITTTPWLFNLLEIRRGSLSGVDRHRALLSRGGGKMNISNLPQQQVSLKSAFAQGYLCSLLNRRPPCSSAVFTGCCRSIPVWATSCGTRGLFSACRSSGGHCWCS